MSYPNKYGKIGIRLFLPNTKKLLSKSMLSPHSKECVLSCLLITPITSPYEHSPFKLNLPNYHSVQDVEKDNESDKEHYISAIIPPQLEKFDDKFRDSHIN